MELDITLDVNVARLAHIEWENKLEKMVNDGATFPELKGHDNCALGAWIYARGLRKYGDLPETIALKNAHHHFHEIADKILDFQANSPHENAQPLLIKLRQFSNKIIVLLTSLELSIARKKNHHAGSWKKLHHFLGQSETMQPFPMYLRDQALPWYAFRKKRVAHLASMFDINAARLNHLLWTQNLQTRFAKFRKGEHVQGADDCDLGIWIHTLGKKAFGNSENFNILEETHAAFHDLAAKIERALRRQDAKYAEVAYQQLNSASTTIIVQLTRLELQMQDAKMSAERMQSIQI
ncbi:MAG: CZB domain-containing protein [Zetaproteobacteria bacterium]|nr:CZB domain-containing protein [Zetaproteobacteria bacterium]